jgi:hypothetical protein
MNEDYLFNMSAKSAKELSFEDKQKWFKIQTEKFRIPWNYGSDNLEICEKNLIESTLKGLKKTNLHKVFSSVFGNNLFF